MVVSIFVSFSTSQVKAAAWPLLELQTCFGATSSPKNLNFMRCFFEVWVPFKGVKHRGCRDVNVKGSDALREKMEPLNPKPEQGKVT